MCRVALRHHLEPLCALGSPVGKKGLEEQETIEAREGHFLTCQRSPMATATPRAWLRCQESPLGQARVTDKQVKGCGAGKRRLWLP